MNERCIRCGGAAAYPVRALEVRTLHVRSLGGERRVQALGEELARGVCENCARESLALSMDPVRAVRKQLRCFSAVFAAGLLVIAVSLLFLDGKTLFVLLGIAALACGVLGAAEALKNAKDKARTLRSLPENDALEEAAWDVFTAEAPKKEGDNDLTYIPVNEKTLKRKNGDLMILYSLLPDIAVQAWNRLHPSPEKTEEKKEESNDPPYRDV